MGKRDAPSDAHQDSLRKKRRKHETGGPNGHPPASSSKPEEIQTARQIQGLLRFQQDADLTSGIQSFKSFLDSILYPPDPDEVGTKRAILYEFLESQKPRNGDAQTAYLSEVMQTWSFASQANNDNLVGAVAAVLALLLKLLSTRLEFREHGISLCKTLLRIPQLRLLRRSLGAPKHKAFIISPALRLLTELIAFDAGVLARELYTHREYTFEPQIIAHHISGRGEPPARDPSRPSVRSNAIRYLLANFKYQSEGAKVDIIKHGNISRALFAHVDNDAPSLVKEVLDVVSKHVLLDEEIPRGNKTYFLDDRNLVSILGVCRRRDDGALEGSETSVQHVAMDFLRLVCTTPNLGVHLPCRGWYSSSAESEDADVDETESELFPATWHSEPAATTSNILNRTLASFIHVLRPFASVPEMDLLVDVFKAAPELVADYFIKKASFTFEPNLTATWIGYSAFLFSVVQLPIPAHDFERPPPVSAVAASILPEPLDQKTLTKCIINSSDTIRFFAARILVVAISKLKEVVTSFESRGHQWQAAARRLENEVARRCPPTKDLIALLKRSSGKTAQYEASARLLRLYYEVVPWLAIEEKLDISTLITLELQRLQSPSDERDPTARGMDLLTLTHLLATAQLATGMQWWKKPEGLLYTPFLTLILRVVADPPFFTQNKPLFEALGEEAGMSPDVLGALVYSLSTENHRPPQVLEFVDECFRRLIRAPIKYGDDLEAISETREQLNTVPTLLMTILEQLPFPEKAGNALSVARWVRGFIDHLRLVKNVNRGLLKLIKDRMADCLKDPKAVGRLSAPLRPPPLSPPKHRTVATTGATTNGVHQKPDAAQLSPHDFAARLEAHKPPEEDEKHAGLHRWLQQDVSEVLEAGVPALLYLCSDDVSIRRQAVINLAKFIARLDPGDPEQLQHYILLSELRETIADGEARSHADENSNGEYILPYLAATFASRAIVVLNDPMHLIYTKLNLFLIASPSWNITSLVSHWLKTVFDHPTDSGGSTSGPATAREETEWLVSWLHDGLRTSRDMDVLRRCRAFEKVLAHCGAPMAPKPLRTAAVGLLMRAVWVEGASTTLITRSGILGWLGGQAALVGGAEERAVLRAVRVRLWETCDQARVDAWSKGEVRRMMTREGEVHAS